MSQCPQCGYSTEKSQRSNRQNRYFHGVVLQRLEASEHGYTSKEWKEIIRSEFLRKWIVLETKSGPKEIEIERSTTDLNTKEFEDIMTKVRQWASFEMSVWIPEPNEVPFEDTK